jgi:hypothetical protein
MDMGPYKIQSAGKNDIEFVHQKDLNKLIDDPVKV